MRPRVAVVLAAGLVLTCRDDEPIAWEIVLGVDVQLDDVEWNDGNSCLVAVGAEGTVVHRDYGGDVLSWTLGDADLHAVDYAYTSTGPMLWFVVGDAGTIHVGHDTEKVDEHDHELTWFTQTSLDADLHGVAVLRGDDSWDDPLVVVVGDEFLATGVPTDELGIFEWTESPPPPGGWGRLRHVSAVAFPSYEIRAVGDEGRMWTTDLGPAGWVAVDLGTDADLVDGDYYGYSAQGRFCGSEGTLVTCEDGVCSTAQVGEFDFVACNWVWGIDSNRRILDLRADEIEELDQLEWQPRAMSYFSKGVVMVSDEGHAGTWYDNEQLYVGCL